MQTKECQVVMLPTVPKALWHSPIAEFEGVLKGIRTDTIDKLGFNTRPGVGYSTEMWQPQHLYFTSNEEIKEGGFALNKLAEKVDKVSSDMRRFEMSLHSPSWRMIVASTDPSLGLPSIPEEWIRTKYVPANGKIDKVLLETQLYDRGAAGNRVIYSKLKLTDKNEVVIVDYKYESLLDSVLRDAELEDTAKKWNKPFIISQGGFGEMAFKADWKAHEEYLKNKEEISNNSMFTSE